MAEQNINVAQQDTLESVSSKIDTLDTVADNIYSKVDTEVAAVKTKTDLIGATGDTGGSATAGSIMAKLNGIFTNAARLTSARATKIDNIGATSDTGGSTSAGTVMGKLNAIISSLANISGSSINASDITAIKTATAVNNTASTSGTLSQKISSAIANTATNNTENKTGILSQKITYLINRLGKTVLASNTVIKTLSTSGSVVVTSSTSDTNLSKVVYSNYTGYSTFLASGVYRFSATGSIKIDKVNHADAGVNTAVVEIEHISVSGGTSTHSFTLISSESATSATKYLDVPVSAGDRIRCRFKCYNLGYTDNCSFAYLGDNFTFTWTDISIRGTVQEATSGGVLI